MEGKWRENVGAEGMPSGDATRFKGKERWENVDKRRHVVENKQAVITVRRSSVNAAHTWAALKSGDCVTQSQLGRVCGETTKTNQCLICMVPPSSHCVTPSEVVPLFGGASMGEACFICWSSARSRWMLPANSLSDSVSPPVCGNERSAPGGQLSTNSYLHFGGQWTQSVWQEWDQAGEQNNGLIGCQWETMLANFNWVSNWQQFSELTENAATDV